MDGHASADAAQALGITPATLRKWTEEFADWLSPAAGDPRERRYADDDLRVLRRAAKLLKRRRGFAYVRECLATELDVPARERVVGEAIEPEPPPATEQADGPAAVELVVIEPEPRVPPISPACWSAWPSCTASCCATRSRRSARCPTHLL